MRRKYIMFKKLMEIHFVELPKFQTFKKENRHIKGDTLEEWLTFLSSETSEEELDIIISKNIDIEKADKRLEMLSSDKETLMLYNKRMDAERDFDNALEGRELKAKFEMARNFLSMGLTIEQVAEGTKLTIDEVRKLNG
jgi:predicted transposase/invertase (TIGR01784 family)